MAIGTIVTMALALILLAVLLYLSYQYIVKPGERAGVTGECAGQGGRCDTVCKDTERGLLGLGCPTKDKPATAVTCCVPKV